MVKMIETEIKGPDGNYYPMSHPDNWTDAQIEAAAHEMFPESKTSETPTIIEDITKSLGGIPHAVYEALSNLPGQAEQSGRQILHHPLRASENIIAGVLEGLKGGANIPSNIASYLGSRGIGQGEIENFIQSLHIPDTGLEKRILGGNQPGDELLRAIGSFAPYARAGGLAKGLGGAARRAGVTAAYAAGQEQDPLQAALMGLAVEAGTRGIQGAVSPRNFIPSSPLSAEELKHAAEVTRGTETNLGSAIDNPFLKEQFENVFSKLPLSGANPAMQRTASDITRRGEDILSEFKGKEEVSDIGESLHQALKKASEETRKEKNAKFNILNEAAEKEGVRTNRANLIQKANELLEEIKDDPHLERFTDPTAKKLLKDISTEKIGDTYSLKKTDLLRGKIGAMIRDAYQSGNTDLRNALMPLKEAAVKDINEAIDNSKSENLNELRNKAMEFYQKEYAPFKEPEIEKFTIKGGDPDLLASTFLKKSTVSDRGKLLEKLTSKLTDEQRKLLAYSYFSKAIQDGQLNPLKFKTQYKALGEKQKKALFTEDEVKKLRNYSELVQKNTRPLDIMFNPKTGYSALSEIPWKSVLTGGTAGGYLGGIPGALIGAFAPGIASKIPVKLLTNPSVREKLIEHLIKQREKPNKQQKNIAPLVQALLQASSAGSQLTAQP